MESKVISLILAPAVVASLVVACDNVGRFRPAPPEQGSKTIVTENTDKLDTKTYLKDLNARKTKESKPLFNDSSIDNEVQYLESRGITAAQIKQAYEFVESLKTHDGYRMIPDEGDFSALNWAAQLAEMKVDLKKLAAAMEVIGSIKKDDMWVFLFSDLMDKSIQLAQSNRSTQEFLDMYNYLSDLKAQDNQDEFAPDASAQIALKALSTAGFDISKFKEKIKSLKEKAAAKLEKQSSLVRAALLEQKVSLEVLDEKIFGQAEKATDESNGTDNN